MEPVIGLIVYFIYFVGYSIGLYMYIRIVHVAYSIV